MVLSINGVNAVIFASRDKPGRLKIGLTSALSLLFLASAGCSAETEHAPSTATEATGILETAAGNYVFTAMTCAIHQEDGFDDIEIGGPGAAPDGEVFYLELSSTGNELSVNLGVDGSFVSADRVLQAGRFVSEEFSLEVSDRIISVANLTLVDESGQLADDGATMTIDCSI